MIRVKACFVAEGVITDKDSGQVSAYSLVESIEAPSYPVVVQKIAFFCLWERTLADPALLRAEFTVLLDGKELVRQPVDIDFGSGLRNRCTIRLDGFAPERPGKFLFRLALPGHETAEWSFTASVAPPSAVAGVGLGDVPTWNSGQFSMSIGTVNVHRR